MEQEEFDDVSIKFDPLQNNMKRNLNLKHKISRAKIVSSALLLASVFGLLVYSSWYVRKTTETVTQAGPQAKLSLEPTSANLNIGEEYPVYIILDTQEAQVNAVDIRLAYDKDTFEITDQDPSKTGIQSAVDPNTFKFNPINDVDTDKAEVKISLVAYDVNKRLPTAPFKGKKNIASIKFRPKKSSNSAKFNFRYSPGVTNDSNIADAASNQDILSEVNGATFKIASPKISVNARGIAQNGIVPSLKLSIKDGAVEKVYDTNGVASTESDIAFEVSQNISNGNIIYFDFENDTRDRNDNKAGNANRDIYVNKITIADRVFYLNPTNDTEKAIAAKDRDENRIYYDRADREGGSVYENGRFGPFGNARDGKKDGSGSNAKYTQGYLEYDRPVGFGPLFTGQMLWNGAIVIKVDWIGSKSASNVSPQITTINQNSPSPTILPQNVAPVEVFRSADLLVPINGATLSKDGNLFNWSTGENAVSYTLKVGTKSNDIAYYNKNFVAETKAIVSGLPSDGSEVVVKLASKFSDNKIDEKTYTFSTIKDENDVFPTNPANLKAETPSPLTFPSTVASCNDPTGEKYNVVFLSKSLNDRDPANHADMNLSLRGYSKITSDSNLKDFVNVNGNSDFLAPDLADVVGSSFSGKFSTVHRINNWNWQPIPKTGTKGGSITYPAVTMVGIPVSTNQILKTPSSGYVLTEDNFKAVVLYADKNRLTINYTLDDTVSTGYTIHFENICVDPELLALYQKASPSGTIKRTQLPGLKSMQPFGRANGTEFLISIRDKGSFMDPRSKKDWWK